MREISPAVNMSAEEFLALLPPEAQQLIAEIRRQKQAGARRLPSATLVDNSSLLTEVQRGALLDAVAQLVDENLGGRSEMCIQFADLLSRALTHLSLPARAAVGRATYMSAAGREIFQWDHAWVRVGHEVIDGNVDCLSENPMVPEGLECCPLLGADQASAGR